MKLVDAGSTSPKLLEEVSNWEDHAAWVRFRDRYDGLLRSWCRGYGLDNDSVNEVSQEIWIELAERMKTFEYDPNGNSRGWLRRLCGYRVIDFLRRRRTRCPFPLDDRDAERIIGDPEPETEEEEGEPLSNQDGLRFRRKVEAIQAAVKARVKPHNWEGFWLVAVCDWSVERTAQALGMSHAAVYAAKERVTKMLREEAERFSENESCSS